MTRIRILDPTAPPPEVDADPGPSLAASDPQGRRVGIRYDPTWRSFDWVRDEWTRSLREAGASVEGWCAGDRGGEAGRATETELEGFVRANDVVVAGLGN